MKRLALVAPLALILVFLPASAQENGTNTLQLVSPGEEPMIEQMSEKGA